MTRTGTATTRAAITIAAVLALLVAGCGGSSSAQGGGGGSYSIGYTGDLSGSLAAIGSGLRDGYTTYFKQVNNAGGINGHQIDFTALDDASDPTKGVANVKQLTQSKHVTGTFVFLSNVIAAAQPVLQATQTPAIVQAMPPDLLHPAHRDIFAGDILIGDEAKPMYAFLSRHAHGGSPRVGIISAQTAALSALVANAQRQAKDKGWPIAGSEQVSLDATSARPQATALASKRPDVVVMALTDPLAISATQTLRSRGFKGMIVNYDGGSASSTLKKLDDPDFYVVRPYAFVGTANEAPGVKQFAQAAKAANVDPNQPFVVNGYVQAYVMGQALQKCGFPCPAQKLEATLPTMSHLDTRGLTFGKWTYSSSDHSGIQGVEIFHWDGKTDAPAAASGVLAI